MFHSGNQTTDVPQGVLPTPAAAAATLDRCRSRAPADTLPAPQVGVMLKYQSGDHLASTSNGVAHTDVVRFSLPDHDVFAIDADATRSTRAVTSSLDHVGTVLFNMVVNPATGVVYVSNTDANNMDRFEGFGAAEPARRAAQRAHLDDLRRRRRSAAAPEPAHRLRAG